MPKSWRIMKVVTKSISVSRLIALPRLEPFVDISMGSISLAMASLLMSLTSV